jgi:hypothetical protein
MWVFVIKTVCYTTLICFFRCKSFGGDMLGVETSHLVLERDRNRAVD